MRYLLFLILFGLAACGESPSSPGEDRLASEEMLGDWLAQWLSGSLAPAPVYWRLEGTKTITVMTEGRLAIGDDDTWQYTEQFRIYYLWEPVRDSAVVHWGEIEQNEEGLLLLWDRSPARYNTEVERYALGRLTWSDGEVLRADCHGLGSDDYFVRPAAWRAMSTPAGWMNGTLWRASGGGGSWEGHPLPFQQDTDWGYEETISADVAFRSNEQISVTLRVNGYPDGLPPWGRDRTTWGTYSRADSIDAMALVMPEGESWTGAVTGNRLTLIHPDGSISELVYWPW